MAQHEDRAVRTRASGMLRSVAVAAVVAAAVSAMYYSSDLRSLAHTYGIWVLVGWVVSFARPLGLAVAVSTASLAVSVAVFFVGLKLFHDVKWAAAGSTLSVDWDRAALWMLLAVPVGVLLGWISHFALNESWRGAMSRAAVMGVLAAEGFVRLAEYGPLDAAAVLDTTALIVLVAFSVALRQGRLTVALTGAMVPAWLVLLRLPDALEGLTVWG